MRTLVGSRYVRYAAVIAFACALVLGLASPAMAAEAPLYTTLPPLAQGAAPAAGTLGSAAVPQAEAWNALPAPAAVSPGSQATLEIDGGYYWVGDYLLVDGWVTNKTSAAAGMVDVYIRIKALSGTVVSETIWHAHAYNVEPGASATFKALFTLPAYAGQTMTVEVGALGTQPADYPSAVELTSLGGTFVTEADGSRTWTLQFRNDSPYPVRAPIVGGLELNDVGEAIGTVFGYEAGKIVQPGETLTIAAYGTNVAATPVDGSVYCQALPIELQPVFRFYNTRSGTHFYTPSAEERDRVITLFGGLFRFEGVAYFTNVFNNNQPLHRFFYRRGGTHFYTASPAEANLVITKWPDVFAYEGTTYNVSATEVPYSLPVYRFINRKTSSHFYTVDAAEADYVKSQLSGTYIYEGVGFWVGQ